MDLTASERIILHIAEHWRASDAIPELTQKGISSGAGVRRSHVPRNLKRLISDGLIEAVEGRIGGRARRVTYYRISEPGLRRARELNNALQGEKIIHGGKEVSVAQVSKELGLTPLEIALRIDESGFFRPPTFALQELPGLIEREGDLARLKKWQKEDAPAMVVYGAKGMGKTALGRAFISQHRGSHAWLDFEEGADLRMLNAELTKALGIPASETDIGKAAIERMKSGNILIVIDGFHKVSEEVVDYLSMAVRDMADGGGKLLVLAQETTPSYCRFYGRAEVERGLVQEHRLKGLSMNGCRKMLGLDQIEEEALKRIFLLTKGTPLYLDLIRRDDAEELRRRSRFTSAEIRLLMFSKEVKSGK